MAEGGMQLPGVGHVSKKELTIFGGVAAVVVVIALYRHNKNKAAAATAAASTDGTGAAADPNIDPATGYDYGSPGDTNALAAIQNGNGAAYGYNDYNQYGTSTTGIASNAQWAQAVEQYLVDNTGADMTTVAAALGKYLTGQPMTTDQVSIAEQGIAFYGQPPQSGPEGYPPSFRTQSSPPPSQGGSGSTLPTPIPRTVVNGPWLVQRGQTIEQVANRFGISSEHITATNPGKQFTPGTVLIIQYQVRPGDTLNKIASLYELQPANMAQYIPTS